MRLSANAVFGPALMFLSMSCYHATGRDEVVLASDSFDSAALTSYTDYSDAGMPWSVTYGTLLGRGTALQSVLIRNGANLTNGWVEVLTNAMDDGGLVLRFSDNEHYYLLAIRDDASPPPRSVDNLQIYRRDGSGQAGFTSLWRRDVSWPRGIPHRIRFEARGDSLGVFMDGKLLGAVRDAKNLPGRRFGVRHYGGSAQWISSYAELRWQPRSSHAVIERADTSLPAAKIGKTFGWGPQFLASEHPEFGGAFIDNGVMNVYITDAGLRNGAEGRIRESLLRMRRNLPMRVLRAKFSYRQLQKYDEALGPYYGPSGIAYIRIDDRTNQLHIGVVDDEARIRLNDAIKRLALDPSAIVLERAQYVKLTGTGDY